MIAYGILAAAIATALSGAAITGATLLNAQARQQETLTTTSRLDDAVIGLRRLAECDGTGALIRPVRMPAPAAGAAYSELPAGTGVIDHGERWHYCAWSPSGGSGTAVTMPSGASYQIAQSGDYVTGSSPPPVAGLVAAIVAPRTHHVADCADISVHNGKLVARGGLVRGVYQAEAELYSCH